MILKHRTQQLRESAQLLGIPCDVERITRPDRAGAVVAAAAHDLNDELTIIFSSLTTSLDALDAGDPLRQLLLEARGAAQRCAWKASGLLTYSLRRGTRPSAVSLEALL